MIFGLKDTFAIEAVLEPGPEFSPIQGSNLAGRICVWFAGHPVGKFGEPCCWLGPPCNHLSEKSGLVGSLWHESLSGLSPDQIFDRLNYLLFAANRTESLPPESWPKDDESDGFHCFNFLLHSSEAFDGWKAFLVHPPGSELLALILEDPSPELLSFRIPVPLFQESVSQFREWLHSEEQRLLPNPA